MKPIIFSTPMVQAILVGSKTQTRRVAEKLLFMSPHHDIVDGVHMSTDAHGDWHPTTDFAPYKPSDILWVRETWRLVDFSFVDGVWSASVEFKDGARGNRLSWEHMDDERMGWRPSIYMPRKAARIFLRVTGVRVELVQDISEEDAMEEGCFAGMTLPGGATPAVTAKQAYMWLWDTLNAKRGYSWASNPWVWAYTFERVEIAKEEEDDER